MRELLRDGLTEEGIRSELAKIKVKVSLSTINRIKNGRVKRTGSDIGLGLRHLLEQRKASKAEVLASAA